MKKRTITLMMLFATAVAGAWAQEIAEPVIGRLMVERLPDINIPRTMPQMMAVSDGFVVFGGHTSGFALTKTADRYNSATRTWTTLNMLYNHDQACGIVMSNGKMLLASGMSGNSGTGSSDVAEIYDPTDNSFTAVGKLTQPRSMANAVEAPDGKIYLNGCWYNDSYNVECFDPETKTFSNAGRGSNMHNPYIFAMRDGKVMINSSFTLFTVGGDNVDDELLQQYPTVLSWHNTQMSDLQVADYSYMLVGNNIIEHQGVLLNICDDATKGIQVTQVASLPKALGSNGVQLTYNYEQIRLFNDKANSTFYITTVAGNQPVVIGYKYPSATQLEGGTFTLYTLDEPMDVSLADASWLMLTGGTFAVVGGGGNNSYPRKEAYILKAISQPSPTTGIQEVEYGKLEQGNVVYNLQGCRMSPQLPAYNNQLRKGLYIRNGRKFFVK